MRTSPIQLSILIDFMEQNGDLSKPSIGPNGRQYNTIKWKELAELLNAEPSGDARPEEKWRKVWSDYKNFVKKKYMKIKTAAYGTGGGPPLNLVLTENESRVLNIIRPQAATGSLLPEAGGIPQISHDHSYVSHKDNSSAASTSFNIPGTSSLLASPSPSFPTNLGSPPSPSPPVDLNLSPPPLPKKRMIPVCSPPVDLNLSPPPPKKKRMVPVLKDKKLKGDDAAGFFRECERNNWHVQQEMIRQRDEELRLRELELRERQEARLTSERQRERELRVQEHFLELMAEFMNVLKRMGDKG